MPPSASLSYVTAPIRTGGNDLYVSSLLHQLSVTAAGGASAVASAAGHAALRLARSELASRVGVRRLAALLTSSDLRTSSNLDPISARDPGGSVDDLMHALSDLEIEMAISAPLRALSVHLHALLLGLLQLGVRRVVLAGVPLTARMPLIPRAVAQLGLPAKLVGPRAELSVCTAFMRLSNEAVLTAMRRALRRVELEMPGRVRLGLVIDEAAAIERILDSASVAAEESALEAAVRQATAAAAAAAAVASGGAAPSTVVDALRPDAQEGNSRAEPFWIDDAQPSQRLHAALAADVAAQMADALRAEADARLSSPDARLSSPDARSGRRSAELTPEAQLGDVPNMGVPVGVPVCSPPPKGDKGRPPAAPTPIVLTPASSASSASSASDVSPISEISPQSIFEPRTPARHQIDSSKLRQIDQIESSKLRQIDQIDSSKLRQIDQIESSKLRQIDLSNVSLRLSAAAPSPEPSSKGPDPFLEEPSSKMVFPATRAFFGSALSSVRAARALLVHASLGESFFGSALSSVRAARALLVHASLGELVWAALLVLATLAGALVGTIEKRVEKRVEMRGSTRHLVA